jgi:ABC-type sugar transport system substrate-binding protein
MAVEQLGGTVIEYDSAFDPTKEQTNVRAAITQNVDGVIMIPLSTAGTKTSLELLNAANIPAVMLYGWDPSFEN